MGTPVDSTDQTQPASWTDPESREPYTDTEWHSLNEALHDFTPGVSHLEMRWVASDALMVLSLIAVHPEASEQVRLLAARSLRRARQRTDLARSREGSV